MKKILIVLLLLCLSLSHAKADSTPWPKFPTIQRKEKTIYDLPYSLWDSNTDTDILKRNTGTIVVGSVAAMGILYLMPSSFTNWDNDDGKQPWEKWWDNVSRAPVWDKDDFFLNYVTHPYFGAVYYMGARSAGAGAGYSFLYSAALSTFFWEYGVEAFAERPSIQDLFITPIVGSILGEGFYMAKRHIIDNNNELLGSKILGKTALCLMDPITEFTEWIFNDAPEMKENMSFQSQPIVGSRSFGYGLSFTYKF